MFFQHQSPILRKSGKGKGEDQSVGVALSLSHRPQYFFSPVRPVFFVAVCLPEWVIFTVILLLVVSWI